MSLIERDYMSEKERKKARDKCITSHKKTPHIRYNPINKKDRVQELWGLYGKEDKSFLDKCKIKIYEFLNSLS